MVSPKVIWARKEISKGFKEAKTQAERKKVFATAWKKANAKFGMAKKE